MDMRRLPELIRSVAVSSLRSESSDRCGWAITRSRSALKLFELRVTPLDNSVCLHPSDYLFVLNPVAWFSFVYPKLNQEHGKCTWLYVVFVSSNCKSNVAGRYPCLFAIRQPAVIRHGNKMLRRIPKW